MAFEITSGRIRQCKQQLGGLKSCYIASFVNVSRTQITYDGVSLTQFPQTFIYKFDLVAADVFEQSMSTDDGGKFYEQNISITFNKISAFDNLQFQKLLKRDWFIVVQDRNNNYFLMGFRNGVSSDKIDVGTNQQYKISFTGQEEESAPFCDELINNDLIIVDFYNNIFQNEDNFIFQNGDNYIWQ